MTQELTIFKTNQVPSTKFAGVTLPTQRLDDGVSAGFPRVSYKGSKWGIRYQGAYTPIQVRMPDGMTIQSPYLDVVILKASGHPNKAWYAGAYDEGDTNTPPDCWSSNGQTPDIGAPNKQSRTCLGCVHNVWGSKVNRDTGQNTRGKACMDSKRLAVVPVGDIENKMYGGPMMLSVPPSSLKRLGPYQNMLGANGFHYAAVWTRITFEPEAAYPLFVFDAVAALNDIQADQVLSMINHPQIDRILDAEQSSVEAWDESAQSVHAAIVPLGGPQTAAEAMAAAKTGVVVNFPNATPAPVPAPATPTTPAPAATASPVVAQAKSAAELEAEIRAKVMAEMAAKSGDPGPIPPHLDRSSQPQPVTPPPPSAPAPSAPAEPAEPQAEQPEPPPLAAQLPPGMTLPAGMTPEMAAAFMQQFTPAAQPAKRGRKRTPPVSPAATDTSQPAVASVAGPGLPVAAGPVSGPAAAASPSPAPAAVVGPDAAVAQIMGSIGKLI